MVVLQHIKVERNIYVKVSAKIESVWMDHAFCDENGKNAVLHIELDNGAYFMILLDSKANQPLFCDIVKGKCGEPSTDGKYAYWRNGASISLDEMLTLIRLENGA